LNNQNRTETESVLAVIPSDRVVLGKDSGQSMESLLSFAEDLTVIRAILGFILVFLLPGFAWSLVFFSKVNLIERIALSFGLSIALVTLGIIVLNLLLGVRINGTNALLTIIVMTVIPVGIYLFMRFRTRKSESPDGE